MSVIATNSAERRRRANIKMALAPLAANYSRQGFTTESLEVYVGALVDLDPKDVVEAVARWMRSEKWPPMPVEIRDSIFERRLRLPMVAAVVAEIAATRHTFRNTGAIAARPVEDMKFTHALIAEVVREVGPAYIVDEWPFAQRECVSFCERLRTAVLRRASEDSVGDDAPGPLDAIALLARGLDPFERPPLPAVGDGMKCGPLALNEGRTHWVARVTGPSGSGLICLPLVYGGVGPRLGGESTATSSPRSDAGDAGHRDAPDDADGGSP